MASAGSIFVDLLLRDAQYRSGLERARNSSRSSFRGIKNDSDAASRAIKRAWSDVGNIVKGALGFLAGGALFTSFIRNTIEAQNAQAQLSAALESTGFAAGYTAQQLNSMARAMSSDSAFSSAAITNAQTRLLSYTGIIGANLPRAMQAVIDQSARLNISLEQSAETIGRALESPTKAAAALSRQGFGAAFTKEVQAVIKSLVDSGRVSEAQVMILKILEESYGGAAKAARDTLGGALNALKNSFNELLHDKNGAPGLTKAINDLSSAFVIASNEGGAVEAITNRLAFSYLELVKSYNELGEAIARRTNIFGLNDKDIKTWEDRVQGAVDAQNDLLDRIDEYQRNRNVDFSRPQNPGTFVFTPSVDEEKLKKIEQLLSKHRGLITGLDDATLKYQDTIADLNTLVQSGKISWDVYNEAILRAQDEFDKASAKASVWAFDMEEAARNASRNIHQSLADFLFDPFDSGVKGMLQSFTTMLRRMAAEAAAADILSGLFGKDGFKFGGGGSGGSGILSGIGNIIGSFFAGGFATGGFIPPGQWGMTGERGPEPVFGGSTGVTVIPNSGGGGVAVNIINNAGASVSTRPGTNGANLDVLIDQAVAQNISMPGSKTNQALGIYNSRTTVKR